MFNNKKIQELQEKLDDFREKNEKAREQINYLLDIVEHKLDELEEISNLKERIEALEKTLEDLDTDGYEAYKTEQKMMKDSSEPWADFQTTMQEDGRVKVKMDWNKAFINELKSQGFKGSEEDMMSTYFASLVREAGNELTEEEARELIDNG